jgi:predicted transcriptional regulator
MLRLPFTLPRGAHGDLGAFFGKLEVRVLDALWRRGDAASVRDLQADFPSTAYTTLMTTLDRLHRKGVLERMKAGRAFLYRPRYTRDELRLGLAENALGVILGTAVSTRPLLSFLLDAVSRRDEALLDELERLVREKRGNGSPAPSRRDR